MIKVLIDITVLSFLTWASEKNGEKYKGQPLGYDSFVSATIYIAFILFYLCNTTLSRI